MIIESNKLKKDRDWIVQNLIQEGVPGLLNGYQNIHLNPIFINRIAYGQNGFPWKGLKEGNNKRVYKSGLCPVSEELHNKTFIGINLCAHFYNDEEISLVIKAFKKVWSHLI